MADKNNNHANAELLDAVLKSAFTDAFQQEMADLEADAEQYKDRRPTEEQMKAERRAYKKALRKPVRVWSVARRIAASFLIVLGLGGAVLFFVPEVKAAIVDTIVEFWDTHVSFHFSKSNVEIQLGEHTLYYLPKGYELTDKLETPVFSQYFFENDTNIIFLDIANNDISKIEMDNENCIIETVEIPYYTAYAIIPNDHSDASTIVWGNEELSFTLEGNLSINELVRIAKSIK